MIKLINMSEDNFIFFLNNAIHEFAEEKVKANTWAEQEAIRLSEEAFNNLIPKGLNTDNTYFYLIFAEDINKKIGYLWFKVFDGLLGKEAFLFDILIYEEFQGKGYGKKAMIAFEEKTSELQINKLSLHVFGHNNIALELYKKIGYEITDINMSKKIKY